ncbi:MULTISPECIES: hypothetical protein [Clostridia]|uniref:hypothetical protein n=1 Tax=Clostridia TaxID=186801 RepID=UPI001601C18F|nr:MULTISPECIES: hypothetical protein [Clostridia]
MEKTMKKKKLIMLVFLLSLALNVYLVGKSIVMKSLFEPTAEEEIILSEMVQKTIESDSYKRLAEKEEVIAIKTDVNKFKGGVFPYNLEVNVSTKKQTYHFSCQDKKCSTMDIGGWSYSIYQDEEPRLP